MKNLKITDTKLISTGTHYRVLITFNKNIIIEVSGNDEECHPILLLSESNFDIEEIESYLKNKYDFENNYGWLCDNINTLTKSVA